MLRFFAFFFLCVPALAAKYQEPTAAEAKAAIQTFKFRGGWILPQIVKVFVPWQSDYTYPLVTGIDVGAATGTNRFFGEVGGTETSPQITNEEGTFRYEWLGRLENGAHALVTYESGTGTLVSTDLVIFRLREQTSHNEEGKKYRQLLLEPTRMVVLGDRAGVKSPLIKGNEIQLTISYPDARKTEVRKIRVE